MASRSDSLALTKRFFDRIGVAKDDQSILMGQLGIESIDDFILSIKMGTKLATSNKRLKVAVEYIAFMKSRMPVSLRSVVKCCIASTWPSELSWEMFIVERWSHNHARLDGGAVDTHTFTDTLGVPIMPAFQELPSPGALTSGVGEVIPRHQNDNCSVGGSKEDSLRPTKRRRKKPAKNDPVKQAQQDKFLAMDLLYEKGTKVMKHFEGHGWFRGEIVSLESSLTCRIRYEDEDEENYLIPQEKKALDQIIANEGRLCYKIGDLVMKDLGENCGWVAGKIVCMEADRYRVEYEDGGFEDFLFEDLGKLHANASVREST